MKFEHLQRVVFNIVLFIFALLALHYYEGFYLVAESGGSSGCARAFHCSGFSCCGAGALGVWASVVVTPDSRA